MTWACGKAFERGCPHHGTGAIGISEQISACRWRTFREIDPPKGCMISIKALKKAAIKI